MRIGWCARCPKIVINDPGLSGSDKAFEVFVKPLQIYFSVLLALHHGEIHTVSNTLI